MAMKTYHWIKSLLLTLLFFPFGFSQPKLSAQNLAWEKHFLNNAGVIDLAVSATGDVFALTFEYQPFQKSYLSRYSSNGTLIWKVAMPGDIGNQIAIVSSQSNETYLIGDAGPLDSIYDHGIVKFDAQGAVAWSKKIGIAPNSGLEMHEIAYDPVSDQVVVTGAFIGTLDFDPSPGTVNLSSPANETSHFIWRMDDTGNLVWAKQMPINIWFERSQAAFDQSGNLYFGAAKKNQIVDFDPGPGVAASNNSGGFYIVKLDPNGQFLWGKQTRVTSTFDQYDLQFRNLTCNASGHVTILGYFEGQMDMDPGTPNNLINRTNSTPFLLQLDNAGNYQWSKLLDARGYFLDMRAGTNGTVCLVGSYNSQNSYREFELEMGNQITYLATSVDPLGIENGFYYCIDSNGSGSGLELINGGALQRISALAIASNGDYILGGMNHGNLQFDPPSGLLVPINSVLYGSFIAKFNACNTIIGPTQNLDICVSGQSPSGLFEWSYSRLWLDIMQSAGGCDSLIPIQVNVTTINTNVTRYNTGWASMETNPTATFQWLDCNNAYQPIPGATNYYFEDSLNHVVAVEVNINGCRDTSFCNFGPVGLAEQFPLVKLYPNPSSGAFEIEGGVIYTLNITNLLGQECKFSWQPHSNGASVRLDATPGVYLIHVKTPAGVIIKRLVLD